MPAFGHESFKKLRTSRLRLGCFRGSGDFFGAIISGEPTQAGVVYRRLSVPQASLSKLMVWRKGPCPVHLTGFFGAVRQAAALLRTSVAIRRACRPAPEAGFAMVNSR